MNAGAKVGNISKTPMPKTDIKYPHKKRRYTYLVNEVYLLRQGKGIDLLK